MGVEVAVERPSDALNVETLARPAGDNTNVKLVLLLQAKSDCVKFLGKRLSSLFQ